MKKEIKFEKKDGKLLKIQTKTEEISADDIDRKITWLETEVEKKEAEAKVLRDEIKELKKIDV